MQNFFRPSQALTGRVAGVVERRLSEEEMERRTAEMVRRMEKGRDIWKGTPLKGLDALQWLQHMSARSDRGEAHVDVEDRGQLLAAGFEA